MPVDLLKSARWQATDLGLPMPDEVHAVSACLPTWDHNIGYEEADPTVISALQAAYPRFCLHPLITELCGKSIDSNEFAGLPFASHKAAERALNYVQFYGVREAKLAPLPKQSACGVAVPRTQFGLLKQYWQHAGENVSSRVAELILQGKSANCGPTAARSAVKSKVAQLQNAGDHDVFLFPSGMAAIACAYRTVQRHQSGSTCQFGFPYVDTLKLQERLPNAKRSFFPIGSDNDLAELQRQCLSSPPVAVFCEVPTNPLLVIPDIRRLRELADEFGFLLIIDDTLGACCNLNVLPFADLAVTSLTKFFSGYGNVLAGSLVVNPEGRHSEKLRNLISGDFEELLADCDVEVLHRNSQDLHQRMAAINSNAGQLVQFLRQHSAIDQVFYPDRQSDKYHAVAKPDGGGGGLLSIVLKKPEQTTPQVFDRLEVCKGPNLGTNFTLCCPYTILAHYTELDFAEQCGVSRWLLRISVGTEPVAELIRRFERAFGS